MLFRSRCVEIWHPASVQFPEFEAISRQTLFPPGIGLPGRVWSSGQPVWILDVTQDSNFPRAPYAAREGLHGAFGFPIVLGGEVLGVLEFFSREIREPDQDLLEMLATIGSQIGQFIERRQAEEALRLSEERFRSLFEDAPVGYHELDLEGVIRRVNRAECAWLGVECEDIIGRPLWEFVAPQDRAASRGAFYGKIARQMPTGTVLREFVRRDGTRIQVEIHDSLIEDHRGQVIEIGRASCRERV